MQNADKPKKRPARAKASAPAAFDQPDSAWNRTAASTEQGDAFCCRTEWQLSYHETFPGCQLRPLHVRQRDGSVLAFAERRISPWGPLLEPVESSWLFGCPLLGDEAVDLLVELLHERAHDLAPPSVLISGILPGSELRARIVTAFAGRYQLFAIEPNTMRSASLAGGFDGYLSRRSARLRKNVGQQARRAADRGVTFERCVPCSALAAEHVYARMLQVEAKSWKGIGRCGMAEPPSREFYGVMLRRMAVSGGGRVMFARHGDDDIGFIFGGLAGKVYRGQQFSYVERWSAASIGNLLQLEQLRWLCEEGVERYDMGPMMDYKLHWTEIETRMDSWLLRV